jgi:hypothetical protein
MSQEYLRDEERSSHRHAPGARGQLDESARRLTHEELAVARVLAAEGHDVQSQSDRPGMGRTGDFVVCGRETEVKTLGPKATPKSLANALIRAQGQGVDVVVDATKTRMHRLAVDRGLAEFGRRRVAYVDARRLEGRDPGPQIERIRVMGRGFERSYRLAEARHAERPAERKPQRSFGIGLEPA